MAEEKLYRIEAPHFVAGFGFKDQKVAGIASIIKYMIDWPIDRIQRYCDKKGWYLEEI